MNRISFALLSLCCLAIIFDGCKGDDDEPDLPKVAVDFLADETTIEEGSIVSFTDQSNGDPTIWSWTFEGGTPASSTNQNPTVTYATAGTYQVSLIASNDDNEDTETKSGYITVFAAIEADFSVSDSVIAVGQHVIFMDQSAGNPTSWEWTFEGGEPSSSTEQEPMVSYPSSGTYNVSLTASNGNDEGSKSETNFIRVFELISADFTANATTITSGESVEFIDESTGGPMQWEWVFEGGMSADATEQNPVVMYEAPGTYDVSLIASNSDTTDTITIADYITVEAEVFEVPTDGLTFWLQADSAVMLDNQNMVESWSDVSGSEYVATQPEPDSRPQWVDQVLNGHPVLRFDGEEDFLSFGNILNEVFAGPDKQFALFVVMTSITREQGVLEQGPVLVKTADTSFPVNRNERQVSFGTNEKKLSLFAHHSLRLLGGRAAGRGVSSEREVLDTAHVFTFRYDGTKDENNGLDRVTFFIDGEEAQKTLSYSNGPLGDIPEGPAQLAIGARVSADGEAGPSGLLKGDVAEMLLYSRIPTDTERVAIEMYLAQKYGLSTP